MARNGIVGRSVLGQYLLLGLAWGARFLFIKVGLEGLSRAQGVLGRLVAGAVTLGVVSVVARQPLPRAPRVWMHLAVVSVLLCVAPFLPFAWAEQDVSSGLGSIYNATTPSMTMLVALAALPQERLTRTRLGELLVGFASVVVVLGPWRDEGGVGLLAQGGVGLLAQGGCLLATASYGLAFVYLRRYVSPLGIAAIPTATVQVGLGALIMLLLAPFIAHRHLPDPAGRRPSRHRGPARVGQLERTSWRRGGRAGYCDQSRPPGNSLRPWP